MKHLAAVLGLISFTCFLSMPVFAGPFKTLDYLNEIKGQYILSGQHNDQKNLDPWAGSGPTNQVYWTEQVYRITGKYPALYGGDFLFHGSSQLRWDMTYEAERQWNRGAAISIMWHACPPTQGAVCQWDGGLLSGLQGWQWDELLTNGSRLNNIWKARIDEIAVYLQYLEDKGVEVLWRPLHEQNQTAFWWNSGGAERTKALWRLTHDYMSQAKGLSNLIWVWDVQDIHADYGQYNPGSDYFDMMALDVYSDGFSNQSYYQSMLNQSGGKPVAIGECFRLPNADQLAAQSQMTFFMNWAYGLRYDWNGSSTNSEDYIRQVYNNPRVITLDEMPGWDSPTEGNIAMGKAVASSSNEAGGNVDGNAVDGNINTRWSSEYYDPQWISVDLGKSHRINRVRLAWEVAYGSAYEIQVSPDNIRWNTIYQTSAADGGIDDIQGLDASGRYVRMYGTSRGTQWGYSLWEFEVFGSEESDAPVQLYQHCDFEGWSADFEVRDYNASDIVAAGGINNDASAVRIKPGYQVTLYDGDNRSGESVTLDSDTGCLVGLGFNDRITSLRVQSQEDDPDTNDDDPSTDDGNNDEGDACPGTPLFEQGNTYRSGDTVKNINNRDSLRSYRCLVGGWCTIGGPFEPGIGWAWWITWRDLGVCE